MSRKQPGQWSLNYDQCVKCGMVDRPYFAKGQCQPCYFEDYIPKHLKAIQQSKHNWWIAQGGREWSRIQREQFHYGGMRQAALERDGFQCVRCDAITDLTVHHKDGNGRGKENPNNVLSNLETLCRKHHIEAHRQELTAKRRANGWRRRSGLKYKKKGST